MLNQIVFFYYYHHNCYHILCVHLSYIIILLMGLGCEETLTLKGQPVVLKVHECSGGE